MAGKDEIKPAGGDGLVQAAGVMAMQDEASPAVEFEFGGGGAFDAGGGRGQTGIRYVIAVADGDMGAEAVFQTGGGQQIHDLFAGVAAVDEMSCAAAQQQIQGPPGFRQMIVGIG